MNKRRKPNPQILVKSITEHKLTPQEAAKQFGCSTRWIYTLLHRYKTNGIENLTLTRKPHNQPRTTPQTTVTAIITLRKQLPTQGLDNGPKSIRYYLEHDYGITPPPAASTIHRILVKHGLVSPEPKNDPAPAGQDSPPKTPTESGNLTTQPSNYNQATQPKYSQS